MLIYVIYVYVLKFHNFFRNFQNSTSNQDGCRVKVTWLLRMCGGLCDRRANKAFHLDLALLTSLECTSNSGFSCLNTENT